MVECSTQTLPDKIDKELYTLKKQLKAKEFEYNALYSFKKNKLEQK